MQFCAWMSSHCCLWKKVISWPLTLHHRWLIRLMDDPFVFNIKKIIFLSAIYESVIQETLLPDIQKKRRISENQHKLRRFQYTSFVDFSIRFHWNYQVTCFDPLVCWLILSSKVCSVTICALWIWPVPSQCDCTMIRFAVELHGVLSENNQALRPVILLKSTISLYPILLRPCNLSLWGPS